MEEESGTQVAQPTEASPDSGSQQVDQTSYIDDAAKAQKAEQPKLAEKNKQAETPKNETEQKNQPEKQEPQKSRFEMAFSDDKGEFNNENFFKFNLPEFKPEAVAFEAQAQKPAEAEKEPWQRDLEEVNAMQQKLTGEMLGPLEKAWKMIQDGADPFDAINKIYLEQKGLINEQLNQEKFKREAQRQKALEEKMTAGVNEEKASALSTANVNEIVSALPGKTPEDKQALFHEVIFGKDGGARILDHYFQKAYPDYAKMTPVDRQTAAKKFINSITSNKAELRFVFDRAWDMAISRHQRDIMQRERIAAVVADKANRLAAQKGPVSTQPRTPPSVKNGQWTNYFNHQADRI
jgi:murein DD-endopeptidase MepM/ murein hydrolase activator NlpD